MRLNPVIFIVLFVCLAVPLFAQAANQMIINWPGLEVGFIIEPQGVFIARVQNGKLNKTLIYTGSRENRVSFLPFAPGEDSPGLQGALYPGVPNADSPYQLMIVGRRVLVLDRLGWIVTAPIECDEEESQVRLINSRTQDGKAEAYLRFSYKRKGGKFVTYLYHDHRLYLLDAASEKPYADDKKLVVHFHKPDIVKNVPVIPGYSRQKTFEFKDLIAGEAQVHGLKRHATGEATIGTMAEAVRRGTGFHSAFVLNVNGLEQEIKPAVGSGAQIVNPWNSTQQPAASKVPLAAPVAAPAPASSSNAASSPPAPTTKGLEALRAERAKVNSVSEGLLSAVSGQDIAIEQIVKAYAAAVRNDKKLLRMMFMGPTGGGKTFTALLLAELLGLPAMEISGNEYNSHAGALDYMRLLGGNGSNSGEGSLIEFARAHPNGITLIINEAEKMHSEMWIKLMEFIDTGKLTDRNGKVVPLARVNFIFTSNRGAVQMFPVSDSQQWTQEAVDRRARSFTQEGLQKLLMERRDSATDRGQLPPEVVKRIDVYIPFGPTTREGAVQIAKKAAARVNQLYKSKYEIEVQFSDEAMDHLAMTAWKASNDSRTINRVQESSMAQVLERAIDELPLFDGCVIQVALEKDGRGQHYYCATLDGQEMRIEAARGQPDHPLQDPVLRERLRSFKNLMSSIVIGQDDMIAQIHRSIISHFGRKNPTRPFSTFLIGPSGNGKTETGRGLSQVIYGDDKHFAVIPMGNVHSDQDFDRVFGIGRQMQGGDEEQIFEKILRENPDGCVIILDEISNMGGLSKEMKAALFKRLYDLFEEGRYISPRDGRVFDLRKYQFVLTGNDGEEFFRGVTDDHLLLSKHESLKSPARVREILLEAGVPLAFLNRVNVLSLMKPLLRSEAPRVSQKLWKRQLDEYLADHPGLEVEVAPGFLQQLSETFFTADQGGRGVRKILEDQVGALLTYALLNSDADYSDLRGYRILVDMADTWSSTRPFRVGKDERKVAFRAQIYRGGELVHTETFDLTTIAPEKIALTLEATRLTAYHEAGHGVVGEALDPILNTHLDHLTIRAGSDGKIKYYGYASYAHDETQSLNWTREKVVARVAVAYAGSLAQIKAGYPADSGWASDLKQIRALASAYVGGWGLEPSLVAVRVDEKGNPLYTGDQLQLINQILDQVVTEGRNLAQSILDRDWNFVRRVSTELLLRGEFGRERFLELKRKSGVAPAAPRPPTMRSTRVRGLSCEAVFK